MADVWASIAEPHVTLQGAATQRIQCHVTQKPCATLQGVRIPSAILKIVLWCILFYYFSNAVWALVSGSFRIVFATRVKSIR